MAMTGREFVLALRSVAAEEFTDAIKESEQNPHEFSSEFTLRMDALIRRERRLSWRIMNSITSNVAAALLILALLLTNALVFPQTNASTDEFGAVMEGVCEADQKYDMEQRFSVEQNAFRHYEEGRFSSIKNVVYVNDKDGEFEKERTYMDGEYTCSCCVEPYLCVENAKNLQNQNIANCP